MAKTVFEMNYYSTYYFADIINNVIVNESFDYARTLDDFFQGEMLYLAFEKNSNLHRFIYWVIERVLIDEADGEIRETINEKNYFKIKFTINKFMEKHNIKHISYAEWYENIDKQKQVIGEDSILSYYEYLLVEGSLDSLISRMTEEVFYILFQNRVFLKEFNEYVASYISYLKLEDLSFDERDYFEKDGVLKREHINSWVRKTIFFRDRGRCCCCNRDLTGLTSSIDLDSTMDHIVPLAEGGANDISNLQLLCKSCNSKKNDKKITYNIYQLWYEK